MLTLKAKRRKILGKKVEQLRQEGTLPAVLYGAKIENLALSIDSKEFDRIYQQAGESSLITLETEDKKKFQVLIHQIARDPLSEEIIHVDFYQPLLEEKIEATVPLIFEGKANAVEELKGVLVKNISELLVRALPQDLPRSIKIDISSLETFKDQIRVGDLKVPATVEIVKEAEEVVAAVTAPVKEEEKKEEEVAGEKGEEGKVVPQEKL